MKRASAGLAALVNDRCGGRSGSIVVGFDARHHSAEFARDAAAVFAGAGVGGLLMAEPVPTPVIAFAVRELCCDAGVMVTASHNPASDNGYKVFGAEGAQIIPPVDSEISARIDAAPEADQLPVGEAEPRARCRCALPRRGRPRRASARSLRAGGRDRLHPPSTASAAT